MLGRHKGAGRSSRRCAKSPPTPGSGRRLMLGASYQSRRHFDCVTTLMHGKGSNMPWRELTLHGIPWCSTSQPIRDDMAIDSV